MLTRQLKLASARKIALITGGAGFIGSWLCRRLEENGTRCLILDDFSSGRESNLAKLQDAIVYKGSILDDTILDQIPWDELDACYHLAAKGDVHESLNKPLLYTEINALGTQKVLERCRPYQTPFLMTSTCMVYDAWNAKGKGINESSPVLPASPYAASKLAAEQICLSYKHAYNMQIRIARPFNTYGPHQKTDNKEGGVVPVFLKRHLEGKNLRVFGTGTQTRDLLYVKDCVDFLIAFMQQDKAPVILNAGTGKAISILDLAFEVCQDEQEVEIVPHPHPQSEIGRLLCDSSLAKKHLNWKPAYNLRQGLTENLRWLQENELFSKED